MVPTVIRACAREQPYLASTLYSFDNHLPAVRPIIQAEPGTPKVDDFDYNWNLTHLGAYDNFIAACRTALQYTAPWYMICEDDITFQPGAFDKIIDAIQYFKHYCDVGIITPYCAAPYGNHYTLGWRNLQLNLNVAGLCGALCLIIKSNFMVDLINFMGRHEHDDRFVDTRIGEACKHHCKTIITHMPTLVLHIGEESTLANKNHLKTEMLRKNRSPYIGRLTDNTTG